MISEYMGDGVLVYFGYPQAHEDDAEQAVRAGLELVGVVNALKISCFFADTSGDCYRACCCRRPNWIGGGAGDCRELVEHWLMQFFDTDTVDLSLGPRVLSAE